MAKLKKFKVEFSAWENSNNCETIECENTNDIHLIKLLIWNIIKDDPIEWEFDDVKIDNIIEIE